MSKQLLIRRCKNEANLLFGGRDRERKMPGSSRLALSFQNVVPLARLSEGGGTLRWSPFFFYVSGPGVRSKHQPWSSRSRSRKYGDTEKRPQIKPTNDDLRTIQVTIVSSKHSRVVPVSFPEVWLRKVPTPARQCCEIPTPLIHNGTRGRFRYIVGPQLGPECFADDPGIVGFGQVNGAGGFSRLRSLVG